MVQELYDAWDQVGRLYRSMMLGGVQLYDHEPSHTVVKPLRSMTFKKGHVWFDQWTRSMVAYQVLEEPRSERS